MPTVELDYIAAGGNRRSSAADWKPGLLAFGSGHNVALWNPDDDCEKGITTLLTGHSDDVNAVKILDDHCGRRIISAGADKTIRIWQPTQQRAGFEQSQCMQDHEGSVNVISTLPACGLIASGSADGTVKIWDCTEPIAKLVQSIPLKPRYLPLTCALTRLEGGSVLLAVTGTSTSIQLFVRATETTLFELQATLTGHEGWIRSLDFTQETTGGDSILASASQDKYIRLWRLHRSFEAVRGSVDGPANVADVSMKKSLSNRSQQVGNQEYKYNVTFEALLIGHEDWIYSARWAPSSLRQTSPQLLSASADNSLAIWTADEVSGIWVCQTRLGEISALKGSTTATGSTGGFWVGLWQPNGEGVVSLGRTGSWRRWAFDSSGDSWLQRTAISGHTQEVRSCSWSPDGSYLLSTGADQTTRLFAQWKRNGMVSWHEFARPQIHGYDLNCIDTVSPDRFISGADEKLLRVFNKPAMVDRLLSKLCGTPSSVNGDIPDAANIPVLGLSNKAIAPAPEDEMANGILVNGHGEQEDTDHMPVTRKSTLDLDYPPFEEHLARHTLWPEHEKLYGHGYEISAVAASRDGSIVATACKASSLDHAVIRLYECKDWREVKPPLTSHSLTVTSLFFSPDDRYLLSVGRDRSLAVFHRERTSDFTYTRLWFNPKAHSRMILDCSWASAGDGSIFASAGRDKVVKIWKMAESNADCVQIITATSAVTTVAFENDANAESIRLAYGTEDGSIHIVDLTVNTFEVASDYGLESNLTPSGAVNALRWRPKAFKENISDQRDTALQSQLAVASDDTSIRIFNVGP